VHKALGSIYSTTKYKKQHKARLAIFLEKLKKSDHLGHMVVTGGPEVV
jgi:hypothetical protein